MMSQYAENGWRLFTGLILVSLHGGCFTSTPLQRNFLESHFICNKPILKQQQKQQQ
jgi:hypothetical protein